MGGFFAEGGDAEVPDVFVDGVEAGEVEFVGFDEAFFGFLDAGEGIVEGGAFDAFEVLAGEFDHFEAVADHDEVVAGADGFLDGLFEGDFVEDGAHVEVVGHGEAFEAELVAEEFGADVVREAGGPAGAVGVVGGVVGVAGHDAIDLREEGGVGHEFAHFHFGTGLGDDGKEFMGIALGGAVAGEVFGAGEDALGAHGTVEHAGVVDDLLGVFAPAAAFEGVVGGVVVGDVEDRAEVEVEAEEAENLAGEFAVLFDEVGVAFVAKSLGVGRFLADESEAGDAAAFLVDGDEGFDVGQVAEVVDEFAELLGGDDVATEDNEAAGLEFFEAGGGFGVEFGAGDAGEEELAEEFGIGHELLGKVKEGEISGGLAGRNGELKWGA